MDQIRQYFWANTAAIGPRSHIVTDMRDTINVDKKYLVLERDRLVPAKTVIGGRGLKIIVI